MLNLQSHFERIRELQAKAAKDITAIPRMASIGQRQYAIDPAAIEKQTAEIKAALEASIKSTMQVIEDAVYQAKGEAVRALADAVPRPSQGDILDADEIVRTYRASQEPLVNREQRFHQELKQHVEYGSARAHAFVLASRELFNDVNDYNAQLNPAFADKRQQLADVEAQERELAIFKYEQRAQLPGLTVLDRISIKTGLHRLGVANPNIV